MVTGEAMGPMRWPVAPNCCQFATSTTAEGGLPGLGGENVRYAASDVVASAHIPSTTSAAFIIVSLCVFDIAGLILPSGK